MLYNYSGGCGCGTNFAGNNGGCGCGCGCNCGCNCGCGCGCNDQCGFGLTSNCGCGPLGGGLGNAAFGFVGDWVNIVVTLTVLQSILGLVCNWNCCGCGATNC